MVMQQKAAKCLAALLWGGALVGGIWLLVRFLLPWTAPFLVALAAAALMLCAALFGICFILNPKDLSTAKIGREGYFEIKDLSAPTGESEILPEDFYDYWDKDELVSADKIRISAPGNKENYLSCEFSNDVLNIAIGEIPDSVWEEAASEMGPGATQIFVKNDMHRQQHRTRHKRPCTRQQTKRRHRTCQQRQWQKQQRNNASARIAKSSIFHLRQYQRTRHPHRGGGCRCYTKIGEKQHQQATFD